MVDETTKKSPVGDLADGIWGLVSGLMSGKATVRTVFYGIPTVYSPFALAMSEQDTKNSAYWLASIALVTFLCMAIGDYVGNYLQGFSTTAEVKRWIDEEHTTPPAPKYPPWPGVTYPAEGWKGMDCAVIDPQVVYAGKLVLHVEAREKWPVNLLSIVYKDSALASAMFEPLTGVIWSLNNDPWGLRPIPTVIDLYAEMITSENPVQWLGDKYGKQAKDLIVGQKVIDLQSQSLYDAAWTGAVNQGKAYLGNCKDVFAQITGFKVV